MFTDAAHANLDGTGSVSGHIVFLADGKGNSCPLNWQANKIRCIVRSTLAAEALSLQEGLEDCQYIRGMIEEIFGMKNPTIPITAYIDNKSVVEDKNGGGQTAMH